jgi:hypothetical protein
VQKQQKKAEVVQYKTIGKQSQCPGSNQRDFKMKRPLCARGVARGGVPSPIYWYHENKVSYKHGRGMNLYAGDERAVSEPRHKL